MEECSPKLVGADGGPNGDRQDAKFRVSLSVCVMEHPGNGAHLQAGKADGRRLAEGRGREVPAGPQQFFVNICFKFYVFPVVAAGFPAKFRFPIDIRVAAGVQGIMAEESRKIGFCNFLLPLAGEQAPAFQQVAEEGICLLGVCHGANVVFVDGIGGQEIEKQVGPLQAKAVGGMVDAYGFL